MEATQAKHSSPRTIIIACAVAAIILGGVAYGFVLMQQAQKPSSAVEVEQSAATGDGIIVGEDADASGGKYIQFEPKQ